MSFGWLVNGRAPVTHAAPAHAVRPGVPAATRRYPAASPSTGATDACAAASRAHRGEAAVIGESVAPSARTVLAPIIPLRHAALPPDLVAVRHRSRRWTDGWTTTCAALVASTLVCAVIQGHFDATNLILVYLVAVVYVALREGRIAAIQTVLGSILLFDLLFVAPRWSLKPTDPQYFFMFAVMLLVGLIIGHLAASARHHAANLETRSLRAQALNQLAIALAKARTGEAVAAALEGTVHQALGTRARLLLLSDSGTMPPTDTTDADEVELAGLALRTGRDTGAGTAVHPDARRRYVPLLAVDGPLGVLAVDRWPFERDTEEQLSAIANQAAVALERALFEQRSVRAAVEAERERLRSTLLAGISHDFRTPLTTIVGSATSLLEQGHVIDEAHRDALLRGMLVEAQRLHALTSDLLDLTRMEEGTVQPEPEWCPADELVAEAREVMGRRLDGHRLAVDVDADAVVWCDARLLGQALVNLLDNAVRHTPAGAEIRVSIRVALGWWHLVVHDDGSGIPAGLEREVFKKFFRARQQSDSSGTGLGLAICAVVAELHGGTVVATNDSGARFELTLPQPDDSSTRLREAE